MNAWAHLHRVVCLHDQRTVDTIWQHQFMDENLKQQIRKALRPSQQFRVSLANAQYGCNYSILWPNLRVFSLKQAFTTLLQ